ncbi:uncharacterized protein BO87DRAFT_397476 [Aspergillus neoniger CBS 115656]|uniref:Uncharacterized protein n=1 Tax=Aspergillus neoniger (strain CBS 115656) TaxID=1448310 RepID=A0A318YH66_ASPNB|nr:hypothetical protein BO87DRAFT_397476 [Aspergillus neoniger CBS 115656]PYH33825.1 hypothetical protein BO87DRAFT_397476 [Aspergillus neoniger CBS 115656]
MASRSRRTENYRSTKPAQDNDRQIHRPVVHGLLHMPGGRSEHFEPFVWACWRKSEVRENQLEQRMRVPQSNYRDGKVSVELRRGGPLSWADEHERRVKKSKKEPRPAAVTPPESHLLAAHQSLLSSPHIRPGWLNHHWKSPQQALNCRGGLLCTLNFLGGTSPMETLYYGDIRPITIYLLYAPLACGPNWVMMRDTVGIR